jgi:hypothetical protein
MANEAAQFGMQLPFNQNRIEEEPPAIIGFGPPGSSKTTEVFLTLARLKCVGQQGVFVIERSPSALRAANDLRLRYPELNVPQPKARLSLDPGVVAQYYKGSTYTALVDLYHKIVAASDAGQFPFAAIMLDDWNEFCEDVYAEFRASTEKRFMGRNGQQNIFAVMDEFKKFHKLYIGLGKRIHRAIGFTAHVQPPKMFDDGPYAGEVKNPGGPKMPMGVGDQIVALCGDADAVVEFTTEEPPKPVLTLSADGTLPPPLPKGPQPTIRKIKTTLEPRWFRKVRGFNVPQEVRVDITTGEGLYKLLRDAGYPV